MDQEKSDARANALAAAKLRAKPKKVHSLSKAAENADNKARQVTRHKNMISITGHECGGLKLPASYVQTYAFMFFLAIIMTHLFTKNTRYGSVNPFNYNKVPTVSAPANVTEAAAEVIKEVVNATINGTADA